MVIKLSLRSDEIHDSVDCHMKKRPELASCFGAIHYHGYEKRDSSAQYEQKNLPTSSF